MSTFAARSEPPPTTSPRELGGKHNWEEDEPKHVSSDSSVVQEDYYRQVDNPISREARRSRKP